MIQSADYIIIGGGSAGCVLAARLSEDPSRTVLLLEAGGEGENFLIKMPAGTAKLMGHKTFDWRLPTEPDPTIGNRSMQWVAGKALGGGSAINGQVYMRGERSDYDAWERLGCSGWGYDSIFPYFLKSECFQGAPSQSHGSHGPLSVSPVKKPEPIGAHVIEAFTQIGIPVNEDYCNGSQAGVYRNFATQKDGQRCSTVRAYLEPARARANLTVVTGAHVERIAVDNGHATGVEYRVGGEQHQASATAEVIVSAGTMHSPAILMRSGIGPAAHLKALGIPVQCDLPGVGQNLREHNTISVSKLVNIPTMSARLGPISMIGNLLNYLLFHKGLLTTPAVQVMAALRTDPELVDPDIILSALPVAVIFNDKGDAVVERRPSFSIAFHVARPQSRGEIRLRTADPFDKPVIDHRLQSAQSDVDKLVKGLKLIERLCKAPALASIITGSLKPDPTPQTDADWQAYVRQFGGIGYHAVGTCRMGPDGDPMAVLDPQLRVRGITGLRVIDASVMPEPVSGNTNAPTIMIAERGADIIKGHA
ncbi:GMC family oxidoreductase [Blastomonas fulva]|uniref:GMC family oxidoreductase n=1 Tax=Blastomonas fulva TaxID=1550728 RepID=UPI0025A4CAFC|nr:GMC family oxidoreductase N-terminal domain-containing protein [Blastomonas fulva]MDM7928524.1 GMC family oxidoreductase N-terminal domain-containing protein [Blastomonas fulva]MDM7966617.1 GMC family oxidoreductase N-terminal domain-containing protein [Blastomonas fulva]